MRALAAVLLSLLLTVPLLAAAELHLFTGYLSSTDPGVPVSMPIRILNAGPDIAENLTLTITLPAGVRYDVERTNGWSCAQASPGVVCTIASLPVHPSSGGSQIDGSLVYDPSLGGQQVQVRIEVTATNAAAPRQFFVVTVVRQLYRVNNTAHIGAGSLRDAITSLNTTCLLECRIDFDLPAGSVIEPLAPLPVITACARIDFGTGPMTRTGDRTIELSGAKLTAGHGLVYRARCPGAGSSPLLWIRGVAINRFPWNGIHIDDGHFTCTGCFVGTDVTGRQARPNAGRGISIDDEQSFSRIEESVLSGNGRSGLFAWSAWQVRVMSSSVGTTPDGLPLPNGSSGLFIQKGFLTAAQSTIANNRDFGIAVAGTATMLALANTMTGNGVQPIDYGLDGPTLHGGKVPDVPELLSATYDAATKKTIVTGRVTITRADGYRHAIELQVDGTGVATIVNLPFRTPLGVHDFTLTRDGDLTGRTVTVTNSRGYDEQDWGLSETSEVSNAVVVR